MARLTFVLLFAFSLPVGSHHQFTDPGFSPVWRGILTALTMSVALPSLVTAFTIGLSLEYAGRLRGGRGLLGWFGALPWRDPGVAGQVLAALTFIVGGATGIVNGSWQLDNIVHNTTYLPGHFHLTVASVTAMTFMAVTFWMVPHLTGRHLISRRLALASVWLWFVGVSTFATGLLWAGLYGVPRRAWVSYLPQSAYDTLYGEAHTPLTMVAIGGVIMWLAIASFYLVFFGTIFLGKRQNDREPIPFAQSFGGAESYALDLPPPVDKPVGIAADPKLSPLSRLLEHVWSITALVFLATLAAYIPIFWPFLTHPTHAVGWRVW